jgi:hypothetical protein
MGKIWAATTTFFQNNFMLRPLKNSCLLTRAGDVNAIEVGSNTNIQDNAIVHVAKHSIDGKPKPTIIGNNVTIGKPWVTARSYTLTRAYVCVCVYVCENSRHQ